MKIKKKKEIKKLKLINENENKTEKQCKPIQINKIKENQLESKRAFNNMPKINPNNRNIYITNNYYNTNDIPSNFSKDFPNNFPNNNNQNNNIIIIIKIIIVINYINNNINNNLVKTPRILIISIFKFFPFQNQDQQKINSMFNM